MAAKENREDFGEAPEFADLDTMDDSDRGTNEGSNSGGGSGTSRSKGLWGALTGGGSKGKRQYDASS
jgi:hypothetical protein